MSKVNKNIRPSKIVGAVVLAPSATSTATTTLAQTATSARTQTLQDATDTFVYRATTDTLTHKTIIDSTNILLSYWKKSGFIVVDPVNGNNATAAVGGLPYQTIAAALAAASSGNCVHLAPGTYNESNLSPPAGVYYSWYGCEYDQYIGNINRIGHHNKYEQ